MPNIRLSNVSFVRELTNRPVNVSNFKKCVVSCELPNPDAIYRAGKCVIALYEAVRNGAAIDTVHIGTKSVTIQQGIDQAISVEFLKSNTFPGTSVFPHFYFAVINIQTRDNGRSEFASASAKLNGAPAQVVRP